MSVSNNDVQKLAELARIELSEKEVDALRKEIESILEYVAVVQDVDLPAGVSPSPHLALENVMREDGEPHEPGAYSEKMLSQAPKRKDDFIEVKKILGDS